MGCERREEGRGEAGVRFGPAVAAKVGSENLLPEFGVVGGEAVEREGAEAEGGAEIRVAVGWKKRQAVEVCLIEVSRTGRLDEEVERDGVGEGSEFDTPRGAAPTRWSRWYSHQRDHRVGAAPLRVFARYPDPPFSG